MGDALHNRLTRVVFLSFGWNVTFSGDLDFGNDSHVDYNDLRLGWFDHYLKGLRSEMSDWTPVRIFTMGTGEQRPNYEGLINYGGQWRSELDWPLPETKFTSFYLHKDLSLLKTSPTAETSSSTGFTYDPRNPVPTIGGGISAADQVMPPGGFDQRGRSDFHGCTDTLPLNLRSDILSFQTPPLETDVEATGPVEMRLWASSSAIDTDFTAKLVDVHPPSGDYPDGLAINPLMPANCFICAAEPLAPEFAIIKTEFVSILSFGIIFVADEISFIISLATKSVHFDQTSTTLLYFSPLVINPSEYWLS